MCALLYTIIYLTLTQTLTLCILQYYHTVGLVQDIVQLYVPRNDHSTQKGQKGESVSWVHNSNTQTRECIGAAEIMRSNLGRAADITEPSHYVDLLNIMLNCWV